MREFTLEEIEAGKVEALEEYEYILVKNKTFKDDNELYITIKPGDSIEYMINMINKREWLNCSYLNPSDITKKKNILSTIDRIKTKNDFITKLKSTYIKYSMDYDFPYREFYDKCALLFNLDKVRTTDDDVKLPIIDIRDYANVPNDLDKETISDICILESINSIKEYSMIHPKIKLVLNQIAKVEALSYSFSLKED